MSRDDRARLRRRAIGYVFQDFNLLPGLTAAENVALPLELDGLPAGKARAAGLRALDELGLADRAWRFPDQLSGGEGQRVAAHSAPSLVLVLATLGLVLVAISNLLHDRRQDTCRACWRVESSASVDSAPWLTLAPCRVSPS
jgi:ABC-type taurine transport system ATPase subunit